MTQAENNERREIHRRSLEPDEATLSFVVEEAGLHVTDVDISQKGIGFKTTNPLRVRLDLKYPDLETTREAILVWVRQNDDGTMNYGFEFQD